MIENLLKNGDRLYYFGTNFLDRQIIGNQRKLMSLNLPIFPPVPIIFGNDICSHEGTLYQIEGDWYIYESVAAGFIRNKLFDHYKMNDPIVVLRSAGGYTRDQELKVMTCADHLVGTSFLYGYTSLAYWTAFTYSKGKINLFHIAGQKLEYCYESTYLVRQSADYANFPALKPVPFWASIRQNDQVIYDPNNICNRK